MDLVNVGMADSVGISLLISAHNSLCKPGRRLAVVRAAKDVVDPFRMMHIHQQFNASGD